MTSIGQHPATPAAPAHVIAHFSDTHFLGGNRPLHGAVDTQSTLELALSQLERSGTAPEAIVFTGDLTDLGEPEAYDRLRSIVEPAAARLGAEIIWVMGNHDERHLLRSHLLNDSGATDPGAPYDRVHTLGGLRVIVLDTTVPGYHHGELAADQLAWLRGQLATPAAHGTLLALHHPPIPTSIDLMSVLELQRQHELADVIRDTDVRGILGGHLHYTTHSTFAGVPVSVASATCYTLDLSALAGTFAGVDGGRAFNLVHVYDDRVVHSVVPIGDSPIVSGFSETFLRNIAAMTPDERVEVFSNKASTVTVADIENR
ncbi:phosphodiesterase [Marisediminicola sp. LYQ134]|uniref:phosphodiesterase n=1 Tax=Marisediminicola sp. LYQ134 TaxID=3391061 RepID=UPI00398381AE